MCLDALAANDPMCRFLRWRLQGRPIAEVAPLEEPLIIDGEDDSLDADLEAPLWARGPGEDY